MVGPAQLDEIVARLTQPTTASKARADDIRERSAYVRYIVDREKAKDIEYGRTRSAYPRLEGNRNGSCSPGPDFRRKYSRNDRSRGSGRAWTHSREPSSTLPAV